MIWLILKRRIMWQIIPHFRLGVFKNLEQSKEDEKDSGYYLCANQK